MAGALILMFTLVTAGCIGSTSTVPAGTEVPASDPARYLLQNTVLNTTPGPGTAATVPAPRDSLRAARIRDAMDSENPVTREFAVSQIPPDHSGSFRLSQACDLRDAVYSRWIYVEDPAGGDYFSPASRTIQLGFRGDCDDYAIVLASMIGSIGGDTRVVIAQNSTAGHAYPELYIGSSPEEFEAAAAYIRHRYGVRDVGCHITQEGTLRRYWLNLDWWNRNPGGAFFADDGERTAFYPDGRFEQIAGRTPAQVTGSGLL